MLVHIGGAVIWPSQPPWQHRKAGGVSHTGPVQNRGSGHEARSTEPPGHCQPDASQIGAATVTPKQPP
ncbi:MAG TPA: hypothetical protein VFI53_13385, partial [Myxococcaceae bacterium]|nr:hypothetical protein [Myxococcaceae bacterium]